MATEGQHPVPICEALRSIDAGRTLDVAAGVGQFTRILVDCLGSFAEIVGVDTSKKAIQKASESFEEDTVEFALADATALPFRHDSFDTVSISNSLHHLEDRVGVVSEINRVLTPGGWWIVFEMHSDAPSAASHNAIDLHLWAAAVDRAEGCFHDPVFSHAQLLAEIENLQLVDLNIVEWCSDEDPLDEENVERTVQLIHQVLKRVEGADIEQTLTTQAESLIQRINQEGIQFQPFVLAMGKTAKSG